MSGTDGVEDEYHSTGEEDGWRVRGCGAVALPLAGTSLSFVRFT